MKTVKEWLELIEGPIIRERVLANLNRKNSEGMRENITQALYAAFTWSRSPEGIGYWVDFKNSEIKLLPHSLNDYKED